ncbi:meiotic nuclear division protein 1 homolog [Eurytemora carolleeae]|uniref:meiotic nuclear division protein 1 homolog n=1 Tax=Eurytemora carolleeae TaxID=1294199 RepID=UPI000C77C7C8|nr:meiotic nuclear division protein 1 homolog [Eurytemora carolleeae]|eukprot:XP_023320790.1 meiotic nuclear division protein 1 homolog [Eurytemora affinis]
MASKKKGLSLEEKRKKMMEIFFESKDVYLLKDLEKIAPKLKGITSMSVKDVVTSLVDDGMVDTDKIGTSVYFWAFPSKASANRKRKLDKLQEQLNTVEKKAKLSEKDLNSAASGREDTEERKDILDRLNEAEKKNKELKENLAQYADNDPEVLKQMEVESKKALESVNRWTDNIFSLQEWIKKKFPSISQAEFNKQFNIPEDLDYIQ